MVLQFVRHHAWLGDSLGPAGTGKIASGESESRRLHLSKSKIVKP